MFVIAETPAIITPSGSIPRSPIARSPDGVYRPRQRDAGGVTHEIRRHEVVAQNQCDARLLAQGVEPGRVGKLAELDAERDRQRNGGQREARRRRPHQAQHEEHRRRPQGVPRILRNHERQGAPIDARPKTERHSHDQQHERTAGLIAGARHSEVASNQWTQPPALPLVWFMLDQAERAKLIEEPRRSCHSVASALTGSIAEKPIHESPRRDRSD